MNTNITQVVSKVLIIGLISIVFIGCTLKNKHQPKQTEIMSQLEVRSIQTKSFTSDNELFVHKAVVATLQDDGFIIDAYNQTIGLITAHKEIYEVDEATKSYKTFWRGASGAKGWQTVRLTEASVVVSLEKKSSYKVRFNLLEKGLSDDGGTLWTNVVSDSKIYQTLFSKIDKAIFLQKENL
jgi:hypothetical protein